MCPRMGCPMESDRIRVDTPTGKQELALLEALKVGDIRKGLIFPAIPAEVIWTCVKVDPSVWTFDGRFFEMLVATVVISHIGTQLCLVVTS